MAQKHPIVRMGRKTAADHRRQAANLWDEMKERDANHTLEITRAERLEEWLNIYEHSEPGPVRELALDRLEGMLGIRDD